MGIYPGSIPGSQRVLESNSTSAFWRLGIEFCVNAMKPPEELYEFHVANLRSIEVGISRITRLFRHAISIDDEYTVFVFIRLYALLLGTWAESRLRKLLYEKDGFSEGNRDHIFSLQTQLEMWEECVEKAFRIHYNVPNAPLSQETMDHSAFAKFSSIQEMIQDDLRPIIELRNKLAHGQWHYTLNSEGDDISQDQMDAIRIENLLSLQFKKSLLVYLCEVIHDLVVSKPTFERDFDKHYRLIIETRRNLRMRVYEKYTQAMRDKYERGRCLAIRNRQNTSQS